MAGDPRYDLIGPVYDVADFAEWMFKRRARPRLFDGIEGRVLDAGVGTGCNMPFYPPGSRVTGIDTSRAMLAVARRRAARLGLDVDLVVGDATNLALANASFDAVVTAFMFCVIPEEHHRRAFAELGRVCRPGGEVRVLDYVRPKSLLLRALVAVWAPMQRVFYGGDFDRKPERHLEGTGLTLVSDDLVYADLIRLMTLRREG